MARVAAGSKLGLEKPSVCGVNRIHLNLRLKADPAERAALAPPKAPRGPTSTSRTGKNACNAEEVRVVSLAAY